MKKNRKIVGIATIIAVMVSLLVVSVPAKEQETIKYALSPMKGKDVHSIPEGSTIVHLKDGTTKVYGPTKELILSVNDSDVEMVPTPSGPMRATDVYQVPSGALIDTKGNTTKVYKDRRCILTVIDHSKDTKKLPNLKTRRRWTDNDIDPPIDVGRWIEFATDDSYDTVDYFSGYWAVPSSPPNPNNNVLDYLFISLQAPGTGIIQPVLRWYNDQWKIASWYCIGGSGYHSPEKPVDVGDTIHGTMFYSPMWGRNQTPVRAPSRWTIITSGNGYSTTIGTTLMNDEGMTEQVAFEAYDINGDEDVPGDTLFTNLNIRNNGQRVDVQWKEEIDPADEAHFSDLRVRRYSDYTVGLETA
ncbi:MAG: hypothetical protein U9N35_04960, partial [Euryarchaeota archaeon]|nr:hypothetical protein [Euryarchaeota archaeon]